MATILFSSGLALTLGLVDDRLELKQLQKISDRFHFGHFLGPPCPGFRTSSWAGAVSCGWLACECLPSPRQNGRRPERHRTLIGLFLASGTLLGRPIWPRRLRGGGGVSDSGAQLPAGQIFLALRVRFIGLPMGGVGWDLVGDQCLSFTSATAGVLLVLSYPIFDVTFVTVTRSLERRPIHVGGIDHTTHRLHAILGRNRRALWTVYSLVGLSGLAGLVAVRTDTNRGLVFGRPGGVPLHRARRDAGPRACPLGGFPLHIFGVPKRRPQSAKWRDRFDRRAAAGGI